MLPFHEDQNFVACNKKLLNYRCTVGMCLEKNYSDLPSNEYSRHYSAKYESEYLQRQRQNMNSKLGEEQKKKKRSSRP